MPQAEKRRATSLTSIADSRKCQYHPNLHVASCYALCRMLLYLGRMVDLFTSHVSGVMLNYYALCGSTARGLICAGSKRHPLTRMEQRAVVLGAAVPVINAVAV